MEIQKSQLDIKFKEREQVSKYKPNSETCSISFLERIRICFSRNVKIRLFVSFRYCYTFQTYSPFPVAES